MKKITLLLAIILTFTLTVNAQDSEKPKQMVVNVDDLTPDQLTKINARNKVEQVTGQIETYSKYAGMGKEIGVAVSEGLTAVKDVTLEFADSDVGKLTMALIVWKVVGEDIKGFVLGIPLWLLVASIIIWSYRRSCLRTRTLVKKEGGWWIFGGVKEYQYHPPIDDEVSPFIHLLAFGIVTGVMFGAVIF